MPTNGGAKGGGGSNSASNKVMVKLMVGYKSGGLP